MSFDAEDFDFEEEFIKHNLNQCVPSYIPEHQRGNTAVSSSSSSSDSATLPAAVAVAVAVAIPVHGDYQRMNEPISVRSVSVDITSGSIDDAETGCREPEPEIATPLPVATVDEEQMRQDAAREAQTQEQTQAQTQTQTQEQQQEQGHTDELEEERRQTETPPPAYDGVPVPPMSLTPFVPPMGADGDDTGLSVYPNNSNSRHGSSTSTSTSTSGQHCNNRGTRHSSSSVHRPTRPKWQQEFACISTTSAYKSINATVQARHNVLMQNERIFLESRPLPASASSSMTLARLRDVEECNSYHDECFRVEKAKSLELLTRYLATYRENYRSDMYGESNTDKGHLERYKAVLTAPVGDYLRVRTESIARLSANGLVPFVWDRIDKGVERDCLMLLLPAGLAGTSRAGGEPEPLLNELELDQTQAENQTRLQQCRALMTGYMEVVCTVPYLWCSNQGKLLYDYGHVAVLLGRHPWVQTHTVLVMFLQYLMHEVHMEHCPASILVTALTVTIELCSRVWVQCWESLVEFREEISEMAAEAVTHCLCAQLGLGAIARVLQEAGGGEGAQIHATPAQRLQWQQPSLLEIFNAYGVPSSLRSPYLHRCAEVQAQASASAGVVIPIHQPTAPNVLVAEIVHDTFYPAVQEAARLSQCLSPVEVFACCCTLVRTITALSPAVLGADDLVPLASCVLHMSLSLGRIGRCPELQEFQYFTVHHSNPHDILSLFKTTELLAPEHLQIREDAYALTVLISAATTLKPM